MEETIQKMDDKLDRIEEQLNHLEKISQKVDDISADVDEMQDDVDEMSKDIDQVQEASTGAGLFQRPDFISSYEKTKTFFFGLFALTIALGSYSEAIALIGDGWDSVKSQFTHEVEYETLAKIHVGNTVVYAENLIGSPQVSRDIAEGVVANYFYNDKFLLTLFYQNDRIAAYTVLPLMPDFQPRIYAAEKKSLHLGQFNYAQFPGNATHYLIDHSKTASYYLERLELGRAGLFVNSYLANVEYRNTQQSELIPALYEKEVHGTDDEIIASQGGLRNSLVPNLYGEGELGIEYIEKSLLTDAQFNAYFGLSE